MIAPLLAALALAGAPADAGVAWSPDANWLAFTRNGDTAYAVLARGGPERRLARGQVEGWPDDATVGVYESDGRTHFVSPGGLDTGSFAGGRASWSPDLTRAAYVREDGVYVGAARVAALPGAQGLAWSPDGTRLAFSSSGTTYVVDADGSALHAIGSGTDPTWSPDSRTLALEANARVVLVGADGSNLRVLTTGRFPQWSPRDPHALLVVAPEASVTTPRHAVYSVDPANGKRIKLADDVRGDTPARWSRTGAQIAFVARRECMRWGVYVARLDGAQTRRSNLCRFTGTARADVIRGTPWFDIVRGLAGDDTIYGGGGGDRIEGNAGDDRIFAGAGPNAVFGGPGNDLIVGGSGDDLIVGGPGRDTIRAGGGGDRVEARDGERDVVDCGGGAHDWAEVDRIDVVRGCETVLRG